MVIAALWLACRSPVAGPDVVIVTVDTLRADRLGFADHAPARTPHLDALAERGRVFRQATTPIPRTTPALASLLTGLHPHHHGSREVGTRIAADVGTLADRLSGVGYATAGVSAMRVAGPQQGLDRGFDAFSVVHDAPAAKVIEQAKAHLAGRRPVFLWVHLADPHFPYTPDGGDGPCAALVPWGGDKGRAAIFGDREGRASAALDDCRLRYDEEIARVDTAVGSLFEAVASRDRPAVVVFSADHGENQGEQGLYYEHGPNVDDASLRVPLVVAGPGVTPGVDDGVIALTDLAPTLLGHLGHPTTGFDGEDASPRLRGEPPAPDGLRYAESGSALHIRLFGSLLSGRRRHWCLHESPFSLCQRRSDAPRLYRHDVDPDLATDVSAAHPAVKQRLLAASAHWPPESARERTVRDARFTLVARPSIEGGYATLLVDRTDPEADAAATHPDVLHRLTSALDAWEAPRPDAPSRDASTVEALRALGYVE
ncbi:MAG: sulfatase [Bacteroidota bacterium]